MTPKHHDATENVQTSQQCPPTAAADSLPRPLAPSGVSAVLEDQGGVATRSPFSETGSGSAAALERAIEGGVRELCHLPLHDVTPTEMQAAAAAAMVLVPTLEIRGDDPSALEALAAFREAEAIYGALPGTRLQAAHMGVQLAAHALSLGNADTAIRIVDNHMPAVRSAQNAALLSTLLMIKAEAMDLQGRDVEAQLVRLDSLGWARYGFGSDIEVGARLLEIAAISPNNRG